MVYYYSQPEAMTKKRFITGTGIQMIQRNPYLSHLLYIFIFQLAFLSDSDNRMDITVKIYHDHE